MVIGIHSTNGYWNTMVNQFQSSFFAILTSEIRSGETMGLGRWTSDPFEGTPKNEEIL